MDFMIKYIGKTLLVESNNEKVLVIGDLHLGFEESLNRTGVYVSGKMFEESISYLDRVFDRVGRNKEIGKVILLGDVKDAFGGITREEWGDVLKLFDYLEDKCKEIIIIKGNHDAVIEPLAKRRDIKVVDYFIFNEYCFVHGNKDYEEIYNKKIKFWIMGHGHPAVKISDGVKVEKFKCFLVGKFKRRNVIIVPSFFEGNVGSDPRENNLRMAWSFSLKKFEVKVVQEDNLEILEFGELGGLN